METDVQENYKRSKPYEYDVALSYAGEDRNYAEELAKALRKCNVRVFFDKYEKHTLWGKDLYTYLSDLYQNKAYYCVMFLSKHYAAKLWPSHERVAAQNRALKEQGVFILPIRLDETEIPGILPSIAYLSWPPENAETIASAIVAKLQDDLQKTAEQWLREGKEQKEAKNYKKALLAYEQAIQIDPSYTEAYVAKGDLLNYNLDRPQEAVEAYMHAIEIDPYYELGDEIGVRFSLTALLFYILKQPEEVFRMIDYDIKLAPHRAISYYRKGHFLVNLKRYEEAIDAYDQGIKCDNSLNEEFASFYCCEAKASLLVEMQEYEKALLAYDEALDLPSCDSPEEIYISKGKLLTTLKSYEEALRCYELATKSRKRYRAIDAYVEIGDILITLQQYEKALATYDEAIEYGKGAMKEAPAWGDSISKRIKGFHHNRGKVLELLGRSEEAQQAYRASKKTHIGSRKSKN